MKKEEEAKKKNQKASSGNSGRKGKKGKKAETADVRPRTTEEKKADIRKMQEERKRKKRLMDTVWGIGYMALGIFLFVCMYFRAGGEFGAAMATTLKGILGLVGLIFPWYLVVVGLLLVTHKALHFTKRTIFISLLLLLLFCLLNSGRFIGSDLRVMSRLGHFYTTGTTLKSGGFLGMFLGTLLVKAFGKAGLYIFTAAAIVICLLFLLNSPLSNWMSERRDRKEEASLIAEMERVERVRQEAVDRAKSRLAGTKAPQDTAELDMPFGPEEGAAAAAAASVPAPQDAQTSASDRQPLTIISPESEQAEVVWTGGAGANGGDASGTEDEDRGTVSRSNVVAFLKRKDLFGEEPKSGAAADAADASGRPEKTGGGLGLDGKAVDPGTEDTWACSEEAAVGAASGGEAGKPVGRQRAVLDAATQAATSGEAAEGLKKAMTVPYRFPPIDLLDKPEKIDNTGLNDLLKQRAATLERTLRSFNVDAHVIQVTQGPAVTRYEIQPAPGVKVSSIVNLSNDIALNLRARSIRIEAPIPGKAAVGIEVENDKIRMVRIRELLGGSTFRQAKSKISFALGKDIAGNAVVPDLRSMPHLLIAGSTGSGKSVCINSIITSILYKADPNEVKLVLIDPKVVELGVYNGVPHLLIPVVTDPAKAAAALNWAVTEMTGRYKTFAENNVRGISGYNKKMREEGGEIMPQVVIIIDELADLMMAAPAQVEESITRLAQLARAAGMHMIVATQRPSVDVITGLIKANIPSRIAFAVSSQVDSRTILDMGGAEKLVGKGDMLYKPLDKGKPLRVQGCFISDEEVNRVTEYVKAQSPETGYAEEVLDTIEHSSSGSSDDEADELLPDAIQCVVDSGKASTSMIQRRFRIGYNRAARIMDQMEDRKIVGPPDGSHPRQVLITREELDAMSEGQKGGDPA